MTVTGKMIHYLLLLRGLERSGMHRREEANTPATLTATERGASTWHLFLFIGLSVAPPTTSLSQPNLLFVAGGRPFGVSVPGYFGYLPDISFAVEGNRILLQLQADVNGV